jgi:hypothetical protein
MFSDLKRMYWELPLREQLSFYFFPSCFVKKIKIHRNVGTYKIGGAPKASCPRVLLGQIPQNTHRNKKEVVYIGAGSPKALHRHQTKIVEILWRGERMCVRMCVCFISLDRWLALLPHYQLGSQFNSPGFRV